MTSQPQALSPQPSALSVQLIFQTNYANKLSLPIFYHLDLAPAQMPIRSKVESTIFNITTADNTHPPVQVQITDIRLIDWNQVTSYLTQLSYGLDLEQFADYIFTKHPYHKLSRNIMALYTYQKAPVFFDPL